MKLEELIKKEEQYYLHAYKRLPVAFVRGKGHQLWDLEGKEYLDFISGLGVVSVGHSHPHVVKAIKKQAEELMHISNLFYLPSQVKLAEKLTQLSFGDKCFLSNSGAEANEAAIKLCRRYSKTCLGEGKWTVITAYRSFHGRTIKTLAASGQPEKQKPFEPLPPGFKHVPLNDLEALESAITSDVSAVMLEPIQGEGGVYPCEKSYLQGVRELCNEKNILLILDEVQTGIGRTGKMFAYEHYGITPDIMSLGKGLASGFPIGATIAMDKVASALKPGEHGSTFGGGPLACAAALATLEVLEREEMIENCTAVGQYLEQGLKKLAVKKSIIKETRGKGLMRAIELTSPWAKEVVLKFLEKGVVLNNIGESILRFLPPFTITSSEVDTVISLLAETLAEMQTSVDA